MTFPKYFLMGDRPVKAVSRENGSVDILAFDWATGGFVEAFDLYSERVFVEPGPDGDLVSKDVFDLKVEVLRRRLARRER